MVVTFEAKFFDSFGTSQPDKFTAVRNVLPKPEFVVSRHLNGDICSFYKSMVWDFSAYSQGSRQSRFNFSFWSSEGLGELQLSLIEQAKYLMFSLIWLRSGNPLSVGTLYNYLSVIAGLANFASESSVSLYELLDSEERLLDFTRDNCSGWMKETLCSLLVRLSQIDRGVFAVDVVSDGFISRLKKDNRNYRSGLQQHAPMPTNVYSKFITGLLKELDDWRVCEDEILSLTDYCLSDPRAGRSKSAQKQIGNKLRLDHKEFFTVDGYVSQRGKDYLASKGFNVSIKGLTRALSRMQYVCKLLVQTFTGMRDDETKMLPYYSVSKTSSYGVVHYFVNGRTSKFSGGRAISVTWVTSIDGYKAALAAQKIADIVYRFHGSLPCVGTGRVVNHPLFVSIAYLSFVSGRLPLNGRFEAGVLDHHDLPLACVSLITEEDLIELEHIDPHRAWRSESCYQVGSKWHFTSHQTRRSLALYAQRSGLVSLPSLRRQLKHITEEMARYYSRGSAFARNFIDGVNDHFGVEWQSTQAESAALSYLSNVVFSDEPMFGAHAVWVRQQLREGRLSEFDRDETMKRFKKGELAYKETIIGGCSSVQKCERIAVRWLHPACIEDNCRNLSGK